MGLSREYIGRLASLHRAIIFRDLKSKYQNTWLGYAWTLVTPLLYAGVLVFLFEQVLEIKVRRFSSYLLIGILCYRWFQSALSQGARSVTSNRAIARRPGFTTEILPVVAVTSNLLDFLLAIPILAIVLAVGGSRFTDTLLVIPLLLLIQYVLILGFAYLLAAANLVFRDTAHVADLALTAGFFLTPIFYSIESVPDAIRPIYNLNPMVTLLAGYRAALMDGAWPSVFSFVLLALVATAILICGYRVFQTAVRNHIEEV